MASTSRLGALEAELVSLAADVEPIFSLCIVLCGVMLVLMVARTVFKVARPLSTVLTCLSIAVALSAMAQASLSAWDESEDRVLLRWTAACCSFIFWCLIGVVAIRKACAALSLVPPAAINTSGTGIPLPYPSLANFSYLDYNATSPIWPEVSYEMLPFLGERFGNPSSAHALGAACRCAVDTARDRVAALLGCYADEVLFTSCGSEADNHAILGALRLGAAVGRTHVVCSAIEHPAILRCLEVLEGDGYGSYGGHSASSGGKGGNRNAANCGSSSALNCAGLGKGSTAAAATAGTAAMVTRVGVSAEGLVSAADVIAAVTPKTALVTIMHSNNEVGSVQPVAEIAAACRRMGVLFHTDAAQSIGKVRVKADELMADLITVVGHKFGAPKGVAALYVRRGVPLPPLLLGGGQEAGRRAGTENVLLLVGLGRAAAVADAELETLAAHMRAMRERLRRRLLSGLGEKYAGRCRFFGPREEALRLPNTLSVSVPGVQAARLLAAVGGVVAASAGAACHSGAAAGVGDGAAGAGSDGEANSGGHDGGGADGGGAGVGGGDGSGQRSNPTVSPVLAAMGVPVEFALGTFRLSVGRHTTAREVDRGAAVLATAIREALDARSASDESK